MGLILNPDWQGYSHLLNMDHFGAYVMDQLARKIGVVITPVGVRKINLKQLMVDKDGKRFYTTEVKSNLGHGIFDGSYRTFIYSQILQFNVIDYKFPKDAILGQKIL